MEEHDQAEWEAVAQVVERWADGSAVVDDIVAVAHTVDGVLVVDTCRVPAVVEAV